MSPRYASYQGWPVERHSRRRIRPGSRPRQVNFAPRLPQAAATPASSYGESDAYIIADLPDNDAAMTLSVAVNASGAVSLRTVPLLSPEQLDAALKKSIDYRAPGAAGR